MKHLLTLTLICFGLLAQAQVPSYVPTNGLVGWWPFNGNANDESGNGNHGTVNGATLAADRFGNAGKAYSFDGVNDWILGTFNNFPLGASSRSVSGWIYLNKNNTSYENFLVSWGLGTASTSSANQAFGILVGSNLNSAVVWQAFGSSPTFNFSFASQTNYFLCVTVDGSLNCSFYINGQLIGTGNLTNLNTISNGNSFTFGKSTHTNTDGWAGYFDGKIDDIAIYNRALSAAEVQQLYLGACAKPTFTAQPQNKSVVQGQTTTFAVQVDSASSFQWQMDNGFGFVNLVNSSLFSGVSTSSLTVKGSNSIDGYAFRCIATSCNADTSNAATLTVTSSATAAAGIVAGVPGLINYQGSALDSAGKPMKNQTISLKLSVLDSSSSGAAVYVESHSVVTNGSGHFAIQIGGGTALLGTFDSVGWSNGRNKYLKSELSQNGTWANLGTSQLVSVPYALVSARAMEATTASFLRDNSGNAYQLQTVNGQPSLVTVPGSGSSGSFACGQAVNYAGESYPTVQIGNQCWFQKNLNVGTMIQGANDQTNNNTLEKYCYNNDTANCAIYGGLYQWAEAVQYQNGASNDSLSNPAFMGNVRGICPTGWHLPSVAEWGTLETFLGGSSIAGGALKSTSSLWNSPNTGATNSSGFSAIPGGYRHPSMMFGYTGIYTLFWSSSESTNTVVFYRGMDYNNSNFSLNILNKYNGFSIRCLKD